MGQFIIIEVTVVDTDSSELDDVANGEITIVSSSPSGTVSSNRVLLIHKGEATPFVIRDFVAEQVGFSLEDSGATGFDVSQTISVVYHPGMPFYFADAVALFARWQSVAVSAHR